MNRYIRQSQVRRWDYLRDVLRILVVRDFKVRYKRSVLGVGWSLLVPLTQLAVFYLVFEYVVPLKIPNYTVFLFTGILPWTWLQTSLTTTALTVLDNRDLVKQAGFPVQLLPPITIFSQLVHFLLSLPILGVFLAVNGYRPTASLAALPLLIALEFLMILSIGYIVATLQVRFRDTQYLLGIGLSLAFYLTPVFWADTSIAEPFKTMVGWNPVAILLNGYRAILVHGQWPDLGPTSALVAGSLVVLALGYLVYSLACNRFVEEL